MRRILFMTCSSAALALAVSAVPACGSSSNGDNPGDDGGAGDDGGQCTGFNCSNGDGGKPGCVGLECQQVACDNGTKTTLTGTVFDPAGKVPIYNAIVYVPRDADPQLADITDGPSCDRCDAKVTGNPVVITSTDTAGQFSLADVPVVDNLPLVIQIGKWRRVVRVPTVAKCTTAPVDAGLTRLPKNRSEGHIPRMALTTGAADPLQCILRKMGLDDAEFGVAGSDARVHLYTGGGYTQNTTTFNASSKLNATLGGTAFPPAKTFWSDGAQLAKYDVLLLGCEGGENDADKPQAAKDAVYAYAKAGGRVFASHYHYDWFKASTDTTVSGIATWAGAVPPPASPLGADPKVTAVASDISTSFPKAQAMADWLGKQGALSSGKLPLYDARDDVQSVSANALNWVSLINTNASNQPAVEYMTFNTPIGAADADVCGRVAFSDIHVAGGPQGSTIDDGTLDFPDGCKTTDLSAQQKALEFMLFDLSSCVQKDDSAVVPPH